MKDNEKMKEYYQVMFFLTKLSFLVGFLVSVYLLLFPDNPKDYNFYAYYVIDDNKVTSTLMVYNICDTNIMLKYYRELKFKPINEVAVEKVDFRIPLSAKVKVLDTIDSNIVKVKIIYNEGTTEKGYIPIFNLHEEKPFYLP